MIDLQRARQAFNRRSAAMTTTGLICLVGLLGCSVIAIAGNGPKYPVVALSGFNLPELLEIPVNFSSVEKIGTLLNKRWYAPVAVVPVKHGQGAAELSSCESYFRQRTADTRTVRPSEMSAYIELASACEAAKALQLAGPATKSNVTVFKLSASTPSQWPAEIALITSASERKNALNDLANKHWSDVNAINRAEILSPTKAIFRHAGDTQEIELVGKGDFNGDHIQDILISTRDSVTGGDYFNIRLFALTRTTPNADWVLLKSYRD